jgi:hypothetical protein
VHGHEAGTGFIYVPWPQSGRMLYEENKKKKKKTALENIQLLL